MNKKAGLSLIDVNKPKKKAECKFVVKIQKELIKRKQRIKLKAAFVRTLPETKDVIFDKFGSGY